MFCLIQDIVKELNKKHLENRKNEKVHFESLSFCPEYGMFTIISSKYDEHKYYCSFNWGMRRAMGKRFYFDGSIGLGPQYSVTYKEWKGIIDLYLSLGFKLF